MTHLHTVNSARQLEDCSNFLKQGDALLLIEDGVYCVSSEELNNMTESVSVYALSDDIHARGLSKSCDAKIKQINSNEFVQLCCQYSKIINWF